jgi:hypothetical protein
MGVGGDDSSTLFVLAGSSLGATLIEGEGTPQWFDLRKVVALDAIGDPAGSKIRIEVAFDSGERFEAMWPEPFCDKVVLRLEELFEAGAMSREVPPEAPTPDQAPAAEITGSSAEAFAPASPFGSSDATAATATTAASAASGAQVPDGGTSLEGSTSLDDGAAGDQPTPTPVSEVVAVDLTLAADESGVPPGNAPALEELPPMPVVGGDLPLPGDGPPLASTPSESGEQELVLRDVIYHGGYPGEPKRRKKCILVLGGAGIGVSGPAGPQVQIEWEHIRSIEAQNSDEAKFRLNLRTKRGSTTLVIDCDDESTVLVEARDVSTLPLRAAVAEMVAGRGVVVA